MKGWYFGAEGRDLWRPATNFLAEVESELESVGGGLLFGPDGTPRKDFLKSDEYLGNR
tara:strand:- start:72 stop:245 length:174 start_codon:yes stop_codon:yes gene_type:complete